MYFIIVHLVAAIVLLLWAVRMVRTAVERAYSAQLKRTLGLAERNAFSAAIVGTGMAVALQSSTAVAALASSFASGGLLAGSTGLALMLGRGWTPLRTLGLCAVLGLVGTLLT